MADEPDLTLANQAQQSATDALDGVQWVMTQTSPEGEVVVQVSLSDLPHAVEWTAVADEDPDKQRTRIRQAAGKTRGKHERDEKERRERRREKRKRDRE